MKWWICVGVVILIAGGLAQVGRQDRLCRCIPVYDCQSVRNLPRRERDRWMRENSCMGPPDEESVLFSYAPAARDDHICCPSTNYNDDFRRPTTERSFQGNQRPANRQQNQWQNEQDGFDNFGGFNGRGSGGSNRNPSMNNQNQRRNFNNGNNEASFIDSHEKRSNQNTQDAFENQEHIRVDTNVTPTRGFLSQVVPNFFGNFFNGIRNIFSGGRDFGSNTRQTVVEQNPYLSSQNQNQDRSQTGVSSRGPNFDSNSRRNFLGQNPYFFPKNQNQDRGFGSGGSGQAGGFQNQPQAGECSALTSFPPEANTGCCGKDPSDADRIIGGKVTEIDQFPWTVLLKTTFSYRDRDAAFNCGGSLISARYVLTAAHCVSDPDARVKDVEVTLAEFDKRTFPNDCVNGYEGRRCVTNIVTHAEDVTPHSEFDDTGLKNDIALIRLPARVPYTEFIRPICLPPIDIDTPGLSNIPLSVAGWGRNGEYESNVKQSTVVRLVPQRECRMSYSQLNRLHLCAAGNTGEDTCKGDSGGPLMILYEGRYYVSGIVSGKRADSPCGTAVPSLYTNVYRYLDWIRSHIRN